MDYKLLKKLKDAGFPQRGMDCNWIQKGYEDIYNPTLSELIEKCTVLMKPKEQFPEKYNYFELSPNINTTQSGGGKELGDIEYWRAGWTYGHILDDYDWLKNFFGKTPSEAVAKLWLKLKKDY